MAQLDSDKLAGGVAVITGGGGGLGSGLALEAASLGMTVIVADIAIDAAEKIAAQIKSLGGKAIAVRVDVSIAEEVATLAESVFKTHGSVRLLINNAAIETLGLCWEVPQSSWDKTINVNIQGVVHGIRAFVPRMIESQEECWIANVSSLGAFSIVPTQTVYVTTKAAVQTLTEGLYLDLKLTGSTIHVSSVVPGLLQTNIFRDPQSKAKSDSPLEKYRNYLIGLAEENGLSTREAAKAILEQVMEGKFWVTTHPDVTDEFLERRIRFLKEQEAPSTPPGTTTTFDF